MAPPKSGSSRKQSRDTSIREGKTKDKNKSSPAPRRNTQNQNQQKRQNVPTTKSKTPNENDNQIEVSATIAITLQQLLLNVFKTALLLPSGPWGQDQIPNSEEGEEESLDTKSLIQTIKSHLYNRDFDSAFADADEKLLRAYALRWSAARALGYAGLFKSILKVLAEDAGSSESGPEGSPSSFSSAHVICIGGGAGAEIVALAAAWRDLLDEGILGIPELSAAVEAMSLHEEDAEDGTTRDTKPQAEDPQRLSITAVDIADWSSVMKRLSSTIPSSSVPSSKSHPAPLLPSNPPNIPSQTQNQLTVDFKRLDVLSLSDQDLSSLFNNTTSTPKPNLVTLMFTLNELFSTSMPKATAFLLRTTDLLQKGTILLVVDSPGSYSTLKLGKGGAQQERQYPMKFLLDHTLLSVAEGRWERLYSQDSRWWRRDAARLWYDVGEGAGLEDMRFQIHVYRRV